MIIRELFDGSPHEMFQFSLSPFHYSLPHERWILHIKTEKNESKLSRWDQAQSRGKQIFFQS